MRQRRSPLQHFCSHACRRALERVRERERRGNRRAFNPDILIASATHLTFSLSMQLEFHQLDRRWEHLRVRYAARQRWLLASLVEVGQQTPIVVVAAERQADRYVVIDGYKRIAALKQLGRDTVEAVVRSMSEAAAVLLDRTLRWSEQESALEVEWLLHELERRFGYSLDELARRFDRSVRWVSQRLPLAEFLPEGIQQQVREGKIAAQVAMKFLVRVERQSLEDCQRMAAIFAEHHCGTRAAGQLYSAWRKGSPVIGKRILDAPDLLFKAHREEARPSTSTATGLLRDLDFEKSTLLVQRGVVHGRVDDVETEYSRDVVPIAPELGQKLMSYRDRCYPTEKGWLFANPLTEKPYHHEEIQKKHIRTAAEAAGIRAEIGWKTFRHSFRSWLDQTEAPIGVQRELMRHASIQTTMNVYGRAMTDSKRQAHSNVVQMVLKKEPRQTAVCAEENQEPRLNVV